MEYLFSKRFNSWIREEKPLRYSLCFDGVSIREGSLLGSGFEPYERNGVTLPEEIDGMPVTELAGSFRQEEIGYIEAYGIKRIDLTLTAEMDFYGQYIFSFPVTCGGMRETLESAVFRFRSDHPAHVRPIEDHVVRAAVREISFDGTVIDDADWESGSFAEGLFRGCPRLAAVNGLFKGDSLGGSTFEGCKSLVSPPTMKVKQFLSHEFRNCASLETLHLSEGLRYIGYECFKDCASLNDLYVPDTVEEIAAGAFDGCVQLQSIHLPKTLRAIPDRMFASCERLRKVFLSDEIASIGREAFAGCAALARPWIPEKTGSIGERAFAGCVSMREIYLPETLSSIGKDAFADCGGLVIHGKPGTAAQRYASENGLAFIAE